MKTVATGIDHMQKTVSNAFSRAQKNLGTESDGAIRTYRSLSSEDLFNLEGMYGRQAVTDYVFNMEKTLTKRKLEG